MMYRREHTPPQIVSENVEAVVKWFNTTKGFGFVKLADGTADAFLHASVLSRLGYSDLPQGTRVTCDVAEGRKGLQVAEIGEVLEMGEAQPQNDYAGEFPGDGDDHSVDATVKFFNAEKGFGFAVPDDGSKDVYLSMRVLERAGLMALEPQQRVRIMIRMGEKGPMARSLALI